jgi:hypothetical protein
MPRTIAAFLFACRAAGAHLCYAFASTVAPTFRSACAGLKPDATVGNGGETPPLQHMDTKNKLYFGDNLKILREYVPDASVDLIYLDPPFNSSATYNVLFKEKSGEESTEQVTAFGGA